MNTFINPTASYIAISKTAGHVLRGLLRTPDMPFEELRKHVIGAATAGCVETVHDTKEMHFLERATIKGIDCYLLCCLRDGSPSGAQRTTVLIKGACSIENGDRLLDANKGLGPFRK